MQIRSGIPSFRDDPRKYLFLILVLILLLLGGCQFLHLQNLSIPENPPVFKDDADRASLVQAVKRQLDYLQGLSPNARVLLDETPYTKRQLVESVKLFLDILNSNPSSKSLNRILHEKFTTYQAAGRENSAYGEMLFTGYYEPVYAGSLVKAPPFIYPLYARPRSLLIQNDLQSGKRIIGRRDTEGKFVPFWTRAQIENQHLLTGYELVYLQDPIDAFFLQIQGSGMIKLPDGKLRSIHFSASNGREYNSIGKLLVDEQKIPKENISMQAIKKYLDEHPSEIQPVLQYNNRFVFFKWGQGEPRGSIGEKLTPGRSIAIDPGTLPMGLVAYIQTRRPIIATSGEIIDWVPMQRFVVPQDTGSAIKGAGRVDLFWGNGPYAESAAGNMQEPGRLFFLVKKQQ